MKKVLVVFMFLGSFSALADCHFTKILNNDFALVLRVCGNLTGNVLNDLTINNYKVKMDKKLVKVVCNTFGFDSVKSVNTEKVYRRGNELKNEMIAEKIAYDDEYGQPDLLISTPGCSDPFTGIGMTNFMGACNVKIVRSIECQ